MEDGMEVDEQRPQKSLRDFNSQEQQLYIDGTRNVHIVRGPPPPKDNCEYVQPPWRAPVLQPGGDIGYFGNSVQKLHNHPVALKRKDELKKIIETSMGYAK